MLRHRRDEDREACGEAQLRLEQQPLGLVDREREPREARLGEMRCTLARPGGFVERVAQRRNRDIRIGGELAREHFLGAESPAPQESAERLLGEQTFGQGQERIDARRHQRAAPMVDARDGAGLHELRHQSCAQQRGFARTAGADDEQERRALTLGSGSPARRNRSIAWATTRSRPKNTARRFSPNAESPGNGEPSGPGPTPPHAPRTRVERAIGAAGLDLGGEFVGGRKPLERGEELAASGQEPMLEKLLESGPLRFDVGAVARVERDRRRARPAKDVDVRNAAAFPPSLDRAEHFIGGAARIRLARRHRRKCRRQLASKPRAEDRDHRVAFGRFGDLPLERVDSPNWHAGFIMAEGDAVPEAALHFVDQLTTEFDIA